MAALPDIFVPDFDLALNGTPVPAELRASIVSVRYEETLQAASRVEVQIANPNLQHLEHPLLDLKVQLDLRLGYQPNGLVPMFTGDITGVEPSFPASGMPTITVSAHDFLQRLTVGTKNRTFPYFLPDSLIAGIVAAENQLLLIPDPITSATTGAMAVLGAFNKRPKRVQDRKSDFDFLKKMAAEYGIDLWVEGRVLNFKLQVPFLPRPEVELRWGQSLIDFSPKLTSIGQVAGVRAKLWIDALKTQVGVEVSWDGERVSIRVVPAFMQQGSSATLDLPKVPHDSPMEAIKFALSELKRRINGRLTARGSAVGDPRLRVGRVIELSNLRKFSGSNYRLTSVTHTLDSGGYRTSFEVRQEWV
jgi:phage protein D